MSKIIFIDWGIFMFRAIFSSLNNPQVPSTYTCLNMILSCLKKIGVEPEDKIIIAVDSKSWRKDYSKEYKSNRKETREKYPINWEEEWKKFDWLLEQLDKATDFSIIKEYGLEADDIMAVGSRVFKDKTVILCTFDNDMEQLQVYDNVKIFSPLKKAKGQRGAYKVKPKNFNAYKLITKKINKEVSDNLVSPILSQENYDKRLMLVTLLELPENIENLVKEKLQNLPEKELNLELFPFKNLRKRYMDIYNSDKKITYEYCVQLEEKRKKRRRKAK